MTKEILNIFCWVTASILPCFCFFSEIIDKQANVYIYTTILLSPKKTPWNFAGLLITEINIFVYLCWNSIKYGFEAQKNQTGNFKTETTPKQKFKVHVWCWALQWDLWSDKFNCKRFLLQNWLSRNTVQTHSLTHRKIDMAWVGFLLPLETK